MLETALTSYPIYLQSSGLSCVWQWEGKKQNKFVDNDNVILLTFTCNTKISGPSLPIDVSVERHAAFSLPTVWKPYEGR